MNRLEKRNARRVRRKRRVRSKVSGTPTRPRLSVFRSNKNTYIQVIDDSKGVTLASASTMAKDGLKVGHKVGDIGKLGEMVCAQLKDKGIDMVVFDRNGYRYHGVVKAIAEGARKAGLKF